MNKKEEKKRIKKLQEKQKLENKKKIQQVDKELITPINFFDPVIYPNLPYSQEMINFFKSKKRIDEYNLYRRSVLANLQKEFNHLSKVERLDLIKVAEEQAEIFKVQIRPILGEKDALSSELIYLFFEFPEKLSDQDEILETTMLLSITAGILEDWILEEYKNKMTLYLEENSNHLSFPAYHYILPKGE